MGNSRKARERQLPTNPAEPRNDEDPKINAVEKISAIRMWSPSLRKFAPLKGQVPALPTPVSVLNF